jgi:hypothetical protein
MSAGDPMKPGDRPAVTQEQRDQWELEIRAGRQPFAEQPPSRRRLGRLLDALDRIVSASSGRGLR